MMTAVSARREKRRLANKPARSAMPIRTVMYLVHKDNSPLNFEVGSKVHVRSAEYKFSTKRGVQYRIPKIFNGVVTYIHPKRRFVCVSTGVSRYCYPLNEVAPGWIDAEHPKVKSGEWQYRPYTV